MLVYLIYEERVNYKLLSKLSSNTQIMNFEEITSLKFVLSV